MISGVEVDYGIGIAMGDFFATPDKMNKASPETIKKLAELIERERKTASQSSRRNGQTCSATTI
jgi:hypothetical protein